MSQHTDLSGYLRKYAAQIRAEGMGRPAVMHLTGLGDTRAKRLLALVRAGADADLSAPDAPTTDAPAPDATPAADVGPVTVDQNPEAGTMTVDAGRTRIADPEQLLARAGIDQRVWRVDRVVLNNYEMGSTPRRTGNDKDGWSRPDNAPIVTPLYSMKIYLSRRADVLNIQQMRDDALALIRAESRAPLTPPRTRARRGQEGQLLYMGAHDLHVGKYTDVAETRQAYTADLTVTLARTTVARLLADASRYPITRILLPVGQDLMHVESSAGATTRGTPQDTSGRYRSMRRLAFDLIVQIVRDLREVAPVDLEAVPGNHGYDSDLAIAERLDAFFHADPHVTVRAGLHPRPYYEYGATLLGLTHGDGVKGRDLPLTMADEAREAWARTTDHEWLLGHFHKKMTLQTVVTEDEYRGVRVRHLPSISALDWWHCAGGYSNVRAMEAYRYDYRDGYAGHHSIKVHS